MIIRAKTNVVFAFTRRSNLYGCVLNDSATDPRKFHAKKPACIPRKRKEAKNTHTLPKAQCFASAFLYKISVKIQFSSGGKNENETSQPRRVMPDPSSWHDRFSIRVGANNRRARRRRMDGINKPGTLHVVHCFFWGNSVEHIQVENRLRSLQLRRIRNHGNHCAGPRKYQRQPV